MAERRVLWDRSGAALRRRGAAVPQAGREAVICGTSVRACIGRMNARPCRLLHLAPRAGRGRLASGALAERSKSGEGAFLQAQARGSAPSPRFLRCARNPTSPPAAGGGGASGSRVATYSAVIPDGERSEPIRDPSTPALLANTPSHIRTTGILGSRLSRRSLPRT